MTDQPGTKTLEQYKARLQREISEQAERENKERTAKLRRPRGSMWRDASKGTPTRS